MLAERVAPSVLEKRRPVAAAATFVEPVAQSRGVSDKINYNAAISAKSGRWQLALNLLNPTTAARLVPNEMAYNAAISAWEKPKAAGTGFVALNDQQCGARCDHTAPPSGLAERAAMAAGDFFWNLTRKRRRFQTRSNAAPPSAPEKAANGSWQ